MLLSFQQKYKLQVTAGTRSFPCCVFNSDHNKINGLEEIFHRTAAAAGDPRLLHVFTESLRNYTSLTSAAPGIYATVTGPI